MEGRARVDGGKVQRALEDLPRRRRIRLALGLGCLPTFVVIGYVSYSFGSRVAMIVGVLAYMVVAQVAQNAVLSWTCPVCSSQVHVYRLFGWIPSGRPTPKTCPQCGLALRLHS